MTEAAASIVVEQLTSLDPKDVETIVALEGESFTNPWSRDILATMIQSNVTQLFVARDRAGCIMGFCLCWVIAGEVHINTLAVGVTHRRQGIATRLVRFALTSTDAARATLEVRVSNAAAIDLYEKLGFRRTAVRKGYYRNPDEDALILWWNP